jgi:hypothetical protein
MGNRPSVTGIKDGGLLKARLSVKCYGYSGFKSYCNAYEAAGTNLALFRKRFVIGPIHDAWG